MIITEKVIGENGQAAVIQREVPGVVTPKTGWWGIWLVDMQNSNFRIKPEGQWIVLAEGQILWGPYEVMKAWMGGVEEKSYGETAKMILRKFE